MKKTLVALGTLLVLMIGTQSTFAACPCSNPCPCNLAAPCAAPCPCQKVVPCCPACPIASPCPACPCDCGCGCNNCCREKCSWWKFWQNKNCCYKCNDCCDKCNKCDDCCN